MTSRARMWAAVAASVAAIISAAIDILDGAHRVRCARCARGAQVDGGFLRGGCTGMAWRSLARAWRVEGRSSGYRRRRDPGTRHRARGSRKFPGFTTDAAPMNPTLSGRVSRGEVTASPRQQNCQHRTAHRGRLQGQGCRRDLGGAIRSLRSGAESEAAQSLDEVLGQHQDAAHAATAGRDCALELIDGGDDGRHVSPVPSCAGGIDQPVRRRRDSAAVEGVTRGSRP